MLIYLDANIVQYCADYEQTIFGECSPVCIQRKLLLELQAMKRLIELEQLGSWEFAAPGFLLKELHAGRPRSHQLEVYRLLEEANRLEEPDPQVVQWVSEQLLPLRMQRNDSGCQIRAQTACWSGWKVRSCGQNEATTNGEEVHRHSMDLCIGLATSARAPGLFLFRPTYASPANDPNPAMNDRSAASKLPKTNSDFFNSRRTRKYVSDDFFVLAVHASL